MPIIEAGVGQTAGPPVGASMGAKEVVWVPDEAVEDEASGR